MATEGVIEEYKVSICRPKGLTVADMNYFIKAAIVDYAWRKGGGMKEIAHHPVKVTREHHEHHHRQHAIIE
jgi:hypothetical protein